MHCSIAPFFLVAAGALGLHCRTLADEKPLKEIRRFVGHASDVNCLAFSPNGRYLATGSGNDSVFRFENTVRVWEVETGKELCKLEGHTQAVYAVAFSPEGQQIVSGSADKTIGLWDWQKRKEIRRFDGHTASVVSVAFSPDGKRIFSAAHDRTIRVWDRREGKELQSFGSPYKTRKGDNYLILGPTVFSQRDIALYDASGNLIVIDTKKGKILHVMPVRRDVRARVAITPDGRYALSTGYGDSKTFTVWDVKKGKEIRAFPAPRQKAIAIAMTADGKKSISHHDDGKVHLWDLEKGEEIASAKIAVQYSGARGAAAVSPDGRVAVTANHKDAVVWELNQRD